MSSDGPRRRQHEQPPCNETWPDDAIDPRKYFRNDDTRRHAHHKTRQLCAQVTRALRLALPSLCDDPHLQALDVSSVEPAPDARRMRVIIHVGREDPSIAETKARLAGAASLLRSAVAAEVRRRRVPDLVFEVRPHEEDLR